MQTCSRLTLTVAISLATLLAQEHRLDGEAVRGEISASGATFGFLTVELTSTAGGSAPATAVVAPDGTFELRSVRPGVYTLRVADGYGACIHQEVVSIGGFAQHLVIRLDNRRNANRSASNTVSIRELTHKVPPQAQKALAKGREAIGKGKTGQAEEFFRQAVAADPEYVDAYIELGCAQSALGEFPEALVQFQKVIDLEPEHRLALTNLAIVLAKMRQFREAVDVARRAVKLFPDAGKIHYILAASLIAEHSNSEEALEHLQKAAAEIPKAHLLAADLLASEGRNQDAARQLEEYLRALPPKGADRQAVEDRLATLQH